MFNPLKHLMPPLASVEITDSMAREYQTADPYPHIVIDNFINDVSFVDKIVDEYQKYEYWGHDSSDYSKNHQVKKFFSPWCDANINDIPPNTKTLINYLNSTHVLNKLEKLTGIQSLEPDLLLEGGGMHRIDSGGKLSVHADYNKHPRHNLYRRINLLLYLNKSWNESWGGDLQIWNSDMTKMAKSILPIFNRAIIFNTTPTAYHGHPHPLNTPEGISRYSIAMYYFTKDRPDHEKDNSIAATWKEIPQ
jgi:Rps23 Pro-64 3,4-dihydroxylase Tpa1-like proline 4-hydroxylase